MTGDQVHIVHGAGPTGQVRQGEGIVAGFLDLFAGSFQLSDRLRNFDSKFIEDGLVVEDVAAGQAAEGDGQDLAVEGGLSHSGVDEVRMIIGVEQLGDIIHAAGFVIFGHGTAAPMDVHIGLAFLRGEGDLQVLLVGIIDLVDLLNLDVRIVSHEAINRIFLSGPADAFSSDVPEQNRHGFSGQLGDVLCAFCQGRNSGENHQGCQNECKKLFHT